MTNFIQTIQADVKAAETAVVSFFTGTVEPDVMAAFNGAVALVTRNGGALLLKAAADVLPSLATGQWGTAVANLLADAKAAGAQTLSAEETLAASTALQIVQAAGAQLTAPAVSVSNTPSA